MSNFQAKAPAGAINHSPLEDLNDFSLVAGGPFYRLLQRTALSGNAMELLPRRLLLLILLTWVPLLVLTLVEGSAWGDTVSLPFLQDIETHLRLLIAGPLLLLAEPVAHRVLVPIVRQFVDNDLIPVEARPRFSSAIASAARWRNSFVAELIIIVFVYAVGMPYVWGDQLVIDVNSWYATAAGGQLQSSSYAGWWFVLVSMPLIQFLTVRWYYRIFIWARFLWQVSRINLNLQATHPDGTAGLLFLARSGRAFRVLLLALGTMLSGMIANRIFHMDAVLIQFKVEIIGAAFVFVFLVLGPLMVFYSQLRKARRQGMIDYGNLGQVYTREFSRKWLHHPLPSDEPLLGNADFQSLADLHNGFEVVRSVRMMPFTMKNVSSLVVIVLLPVAPLLLTMVSVEQLIDRLLKTLL